MPSFPSDKLPYLLLLFGRTGAFFLLSPLFATRGIPFGLRLLLSLLFTLILLPLFSKISFPPLEPSLIYLLVVKELIMGYLLGTLFAFMVEAALLAGSWFGVMAGFSATELVDPTANARSPLFGTLFALLIVALILSLDLHHLFSYFLYDSFTFIPLGSELTTNTPLLSLTESASMVFSQALRYLFIPLSLFAILLLFMTYLAKFHPQIPLFWLGFPLQIVVGIFSLTSLLLFMAPLAQKGFMEILKTAQKILFPL